MSLQRLSAAGTLALVAALGGAGAQAAEAPQYGGKLEIINYYSTLSALSWDPADYVWKINHDAGHIYESLIAGDLGKASSRGGSHTFQADAWLPPDVQRGELAESWEVKPDPWRVEIKLREGVMFPAKPGVMEARELTAEDVVYSLNRLLKSPRAVPDYYSFVDRVEATGPHTLTIFKHEYRSDWDYRLGYGYYSQIYPREVVEKGISDWRNANGTGPFRIANYTQGNFATYERNPDYWDSETIDGKAYRLPYVDSFTYRTVMDESTRHSLLRTGRVDIMEQIRWSAVEELKKSAPDLKWRRSLMHFGVLLALRNDTKPFDDVRVRRAMNMAVNKQEIIDALYEGNAEMLAFPLHPDYAGIYRPLDELPENVRALFAYDPDGAKQLLAEAGYPKGFKFQAQVCACNPSHMELMPLLAAYYEQIGVTMEIVPMEYGAFFGAMNAKNHAAGYMMSKGHSNPAAALYNSFTPGDPWNPAMYDSAEFNEGMLAVFREDDEAGQTELLHELTDLVLSDAAYVYLPTAYTYAAWWPWVKGYDGELRAGSVKPGPIYARIWIDQDLKKKMGY
ncbi:ABC transporter substrate-binding protein [Verticiella sediminum]|uniref:ABC transporter substrate-binding protein n=1 Tax=Verticiella sediminum TaxID=1247510 RepID=A0A556A646_9BURK|nr:ABC transporter substrate-binding protein [Verticiella sediminum]TSH88360.1 ABC transporter substrate-binding protein [Verticiella sediminum]